MRQATLLAAHMGELDFVDRMIQVIYDTLRKFVRSPVIKPDYA
jgi:hypothetical protein